jgi:hypothetical protein
MQGVCWIARYFVTDVSGEIISSFWGVKKANFYNDFLTLEDGAQTPVHKYRANKSKKTRKFDEEIFNLGNLSELEIRKAYQIEISNRFAVVEN